VLFHSCEEGEKWNETLETGHGSMSREIHSSSWCSPSFPGRLSSGGTSKTSTSSHARYSVPAAVFVAFSELISLCFFGLTPAAVLERTGTSGQRGFSRDELNVIVRRTNVVRT
jgi:hypothetical protein